jgi:hypothetical protein
LHGRKLLGNDLQRNPVDMPGLRGHPQFRKRLSRSAESRKQNEWKTCGNNRWRCSWAESGVSP